MGRDYGKYAVRFMNFNLAVLMCLALFESALFAAALPNKGDVDQAIASVPAVIREAKKPKDLDALIGKLNRLVHSNAPADYNPQEQIDSQRLQAAYRFVTGWQDYLAASAAGDRERIKNSLDNVLRSQQLGDPVFVPRSEILERMYSPDSFGPGPFHAVTLIMDSVKSVEDLDEANIKLNALPPRDPAGAQNENWSEFGNILGQYHNVKAGLPANVDLNIAFAGNLVGEDVSRVDALFLLYVLPVYFGTDKSDPPRPKELLRDYLSRLQDSSTATDNWPLLQRVLIVELQLNGFSRVSDTVASPTFTGTQDFLVGLGEEADSQFDLAVKSYEDALKNTDALLPRKVVGQRLGTIEAAHPDVYKKVVEDMLNPPAPTFNPFGPFGGNPFSNPMSRPGFPGYPRPIALLPLIPSVIFIPGKSPPPEAAPSGH